MKCFVYFLAEIPVTECELCHDPLPICSRRVTCKNNNGMLIVKPAQSESKYMCSLLNYEFGEYKYNVFTI